MYVIQLGGIQLNHFADLYSELKHNAQRSGESNTLILIIITARNI